MTTPNDPMTQLVNDLFDELVTEGGYTVTKCRSCGRLLVSKSRGMKREYCDKACRSWYHKNKEKAPFSHIRKVEHKPENKAQELLDRMCEIEMQPALTTADGKAVEAAKERMHGLALEAWRVCNTLESCIIGDVDSRTTVAANNLQVSVDFAARSLEEIADQMWAAIEDWSQAIGGKLWEK